MQRSHPRPCRGYVDVFQASAVQDSRPLGTSMSLGIVFGIQFRSSQRRHIDLPVVCTTVTSCSLQVYKIFGWLTYTETQDFPTNIRYEVPGFFEPSISDSYSKTLFGFLYYPMSSRRQAKSSQTGYKRAQDVPGFIRYAWPFAKISLFSLPSQIGSNSCSLSSISYA